MAMLLAGGVIFFSAQATASFEMFQTFETGAMQADSGVQEAATNANGGQGKWTLTYLSDSRVLSGEGSLELVFGELVNTWDFVALSLTKSNPAPTLSEVGGFFFRLKANNKPNAFLRLTLSTTSDIAWGTDSADRAGELTCVTTDGTITTGNLPANFDGYVFVPTANLSDSIKNAIAAGGVPISIMMYGGGGEDSWNGVTAIFDNVGYYAPTTDFAALAAEIIANYPPYGPTFEIIQSFNTEDEREDCAINLQLTSTNGGIGELEFLTGGSALSGDGSARLTFGEMANTWDYVALTLTKANSTPTILNVGGFFFRLKANNKANAYIRFSLVEDGSGEEVSWGVNTADRNGALICVTTDGTVTTGNIPADFDGYVFVPIADLQDSIKNAIMGGGVPISIMMYGGGGEDSWNNVVANFDNMGYYQQTDNFVGMKTKIMAAAPDNANLDLTTFEILQTFENGDDGSFEARSIYGGQLNIGLTTSSVAALCGDTSLNISVNCDDTYAYPLLVPRKMSENAPVPTQETTGVFFRMRADNSGSQLLQMVFDDNTTDGDVPWHKFERYYRVWLVPADGSDPIYGHVPANFNGWVFIPIVDKMKNDESYTTQSLCIGFGSLAFDDEGQTAFHPKWHGVNLTVDNFGYYTMEAAATTSGYSYVDLVEKLTAAGYGDRPATKLYLTYENNPDPATQANVKYGIKSMLNAIVHQSVTDSTVVWSVVSGKAEIRSLDEGSAEEIAAMREHSCYVDFKQSGTVVIRATLASDPSAYADFTFNVMADATPLMEAVLHAKSLSGEFDPDLWEALQEQIALAEELLEKDVEEVTQDEYNAMVEAINKAVRALVGEENVDTGSPARSVVAVLIATLFVTGALVTLRRRAHR